VSDAPCRPATLTSKTTDGVGAGQGNYIIIRHGLLKKRRSTDGSRGVEVWGGGSSTGFGSIPWLEWVQEFCLVNFIQLLNSWAPVRLMGSASW
jgi:hypothetical protein